MCCCSDFQPSIVKNRKYFSFATFAFVKEEPKQNKRFHKVSLILQDGISVSHSEALNGSSLIVCA